jgi:UDP-N-acetylmuramate--alanine ligase
MYRFGIKILELFKNNNFMHIYFSGIGGSGLSPLANLALDCGFEVSGSDREDSQNLEDLKNRGAKITIGQSTQEIEQTYQNQPFDWIVITSALSADHPHKLFAEQNQLKITKRHELINFILQEKNLKLIAVAGTHGKTTTTGMLVWIFKQLRIPVSYLIGTNISYGRSGEYAPDSQYFVYECDEFDRNMLHFKPFLSVVPSLDYDHPDTYKTEKDYCESFIQFFSQSQNVVSWQIVEDYLTAVFDKSNLSFKRMLDGKEIYFLQDDEPTNQE